jgi:predicted Zn-dependent protease with MMP-like domain
VHPLTDEQFDVIVQEALDEVPDELMALLDNVVFLVEGEPPPGESGRPGDPDLLGIYEGTPLTERGEWWSQGSLPDRITLFRGPLTRMCEDDDELREEIAVTVVHEIAHHFGIEEDRLHELGWG